MSEDKPQTTRTEYVTREFDADGAMISETTTIKTVATPKADAQPDPGFYL